MKEKNMALLRGRKRRAIYIKSTGRVFRQRAWIARTEKAGNAFL